MSPQTRIPLLAALLALALPTRSPAPLVWSDERDQPQTPTEEEIEKGQTPDAQFKISKKYEDDGKKGAAVSSYRRLVRQFPKSNEAPQALFRAAKLQEDLGDYVRAFRAYQQLVEEYPKTPDFNAAVAGQYAIANKFLEGQRIKLFGLPTLPSMERAEKMFADILKNAPFSEYAARAQLGLGQAREKQGKLDDAIKAYQEVVEKYPDSPVGADAQYQIGYAYFKASRSGSYDQTVAEKARYAFEDFLVRYPNSEKAAQARDNLKTLSGTQTGNSFGIARFYDKHKKYKAAVIYYNEVLATQPGSDEAKKAEARIAEIEALVGEDQLQPAPKQAETPERTATRRRMRAQVDTRARPDYVGPPPPIVPDEVAPEMPDTRTSETDVAPASAPKPALPE